MTTPDPIRALIAKWREREQLCRSADAHGSPLYAERLAAMAEEVDRCASELEATLLTAPPEAPQAHLTQDKIEALVADLRRLATAFRGTQITTDRAKAWVLEEAAREVEAGLLPAAAAQQGKSGTISFSLTMSKADADLLGAAPADAPKEPGT